MKCKNCETELTFMKKAKCLRCLKCYPVTKTVPLAEKEKNYVDVPWTKERVVAICEEVCKRVFRELLEDWHVQKPDEDIDADLRAGARQPDNPPEDTGSVEDVGGLTWRRKAKELGISLFHRKKADVLAEIAEKTKMSA